MRMLISIACVLVGAGALAGALAGSEHAGTGPQETEADLVSALAEQSVHLNPEHGLLAIPVEIGVRDDLLEYLLVGAAGAAHESLLVTPVVPSVLNVGLLALDVEPGTNANWFPKEPAPSDEELRAGVSPYELTPPTGDGLHLYLAWREGDETYLYRIEDLLRNLLTGHSMRRHRWIYLGSRWVPSARSKPIGYAEEPADGQEAAVEPARADRFAADVYQNLINVSYFREGYTLLTAALPDCVEQTIWMTNAWLVPERGSEVRLVFAKEVLDGVPAELFERLPVLPPEARNAR